MFLNMLSYIKFLEKINGDRYKVWNEEKAITRKRFEKLLPKNVDLLNDKAIFRTLHLIEDFYVVKSVDERRSAYTNNYYTLLMNNLESWKEYPKRQHICTNVPFEYRDGTIYRVIPLNNQKIGVCPGDDVQAEFIENDHTTDLFNNYQTYSPYVYDKFNRIDFLGDFYSVFDKGMEMVINLLDYSKYSTNEPLYEIVEKFTKISDKDFTTLKHDLKYNIEVLKELKEYLDTQDIQDKTKLKKVMDEINVSFELLNIDKLNDLINPESLGFQCLDYDVYKNTDLGPCRSIFHGDNKNQHEIWLDGDVLLVKAVIYNKIWGDDRQY